MASTIQSNCDGCGALGVNDVYSQENNDLPNQTFHLPTRKPTKDVTEVNKSLCLRFQVILHKNYKFILIYNN